MSEKEINDKKINLEELMKNYELLKSENNNYKKIILINKDNILNLEKQLKFLRNEYIQKINNLKESFEQKLETLSKKISERNEKEKLKDINEIIITKDNNDLIDINSNYKNEEINKIIEKELQEVKKKIYSILEKEINKKNHGNKYLEKFESKLYDIYSNKLLGIPHPDLCEIKKLTAVLIIKDINPIQAENEYYNKKFYNHFENESILKTLEAKKLSISSIIENISLNKIHAKDMKKFKNLFYEKYGIIEEQDITDKDLEKIITKKKYDEKEIIKNLLKKMKYI